MEKVNGEGYLALVLFTIRRKCASNSKDERKPNGEGCRAELSSSLCSLHFSFLALVTKLIVYLFDKILNIRERIAPALTNRR